MGHLKRAVWHFCGTDGWCYVDWADHWQTMITGCLAVGAAAWAASLARHQLRVGRQQVAAARDQIQAQIDDERDRRHRALRAARAALPGVLTAICDHAWTVAKVLDRAWPSAARAYPADYADNDEHQVVAQIPQFPEVLKLPLQEILVHIDDDMVHERISSIFREAQVLDTRTSRLADGYSIPLSWHAKLIMQAVALYVRSVSLYDYARGEAETVRGNLWEDALPSLSVLGIRIPAVRDWAERERASGRPLGDGDRVNQRGNVPGLDQS